MSCILPFLFYYWWSRTSRTRIFLRISMRDLQSHVWKIKLPLACFFTTFKKSTTSILDWMQVTFRKLKIDSTAISGMPPRHENSVSLDFVMMLLGFHCTDALDAGVEGRLYEHSYLLQHRNQENVFIKRSIQIYGCTQIYIIALYRTWSIHFWTRACKVRT